MLEVFPLRLLKSTASLLVEVFISFFLGLYVTFVIRRLIEDFRIDDDELQG